MHELVYSVQRPRPSHLHRNVFSVDSIGVRSIVAWIFSDELKQEIPVQVEQLTNSQEFTSVIRGQQLVSLEQDYVVFDGYHELDITNPLDRDMICSAVQLDVVNHGSVTVGREMVVTRSVLFFLSYTAENGSNQQSLRLTSNSYDYEQMPQAPWSSAEVKLPNMTFNAENVSKCEEMIDASHAQAIVQFKKID